MSGNIFDSWKASDYPTETMKNIDKVTDLLKRETEDMVNHPPHYDLGDIQLIDVMIASQGIEAVQHFCACNVLKYVFRHRNKNGAEDMKKARWYIDEWLKLEESK